MSQSHVSTTARTPDEIYSQDWLPKVKAMNVPQWEHIPRLKNQPPDEVLNFYEDLRLRSLKAPGGGDSDIMPEALFRLYTALSSHMTTSTTRPPIKDIFKSRRNIARGDSALRGVPKRREDLCFSMARQMWNHWDHEGTIDHTGTVKGRTAADAIELLSSLSRDYKFTEATRALGWRCLDDLEE